MFERDESDPNTDTEYTPADKHLNGATTHMHVPRPTAMLICKSTDTGNANQEPLLRGM